MKGISIHLFIGPIPSNRRAFPDMSINQYSKRMDNYISTIQLLKDWLRL